MNELKLTGGARIGKANATFPFATLRVTKNQLELNASIIGNLIFQTSDVISIEPYTSMPLIGQGIKINHCVDSYDEKVIFWTFKNPESLVNQIKGTGFMNNQNDSTPSEKSRIKQRQKSGGYPVKKSFTIGVIVIWNLLFLIDFILFFKGEVEGLPIGNGVLSALGLLFTIALLSLISSDFRRLILKEGRTLSDIKKFSIFIMIICGFMMINFGIITKLIN